MKKILALTCLLFASAGSSLASDLPTNTPSGPGVAIYGGSVDTVAQVATNPVVKLSTGCRAVVNYATANPISYALATKHDKGSKVFGTANDSTAIYWKASPAAPITTTDSGDKSDNSNFSGWTTY